MKIFGVSSNEVKLNEIENSSHDFDNAFALDIADTAVEDKERGFIGKAFIYDKEIFINTFTGQGYDKVIETMTDYINWYSGKIRLAGFDREDIKQLIVLIILDGIRRYNPNVKINGNKIKLSTFLYVHIRNRIISRIKEETRQSLNATYNAPQYKFTCPCGVSFSSTMADAKCCIACKMVIPNEFTPDSKWKKRAEHVEPVSLDGIMSSMNEEESSDKASRVHYNGRNNSLIDFFGKVESVEDIDRELDFSNVLSEEDDVTRKIAELMYNEDYSITDAAREVGLTCWAASLRLKKLKSKKHIREFFLNR